MASSLHRSVYRLGHTDESASLHWSYERTDGRTDVDRWLSSRDHMSFRNARAHIRISPFTPRPKAAKRRDPEPADLSATRERADREVTT